MSVSALSSLDTSFKDSAPTSGAEFKAAVDRSRGPSDRGGGDAELDGLLKQLISVLQPTSQSQPREPIAQTGPGPVVPRDGGPVDDDDRGSEVGRRDQGCAGRSSFEGGHGPVGPRDGGDVDDDRRGSEVGPQRQSSDGRSPIEAGHGPVGPRDGGDADDNRRNSEVGAQRQSSGGRSPIEGGHGPAGQGGSSETSKLLERVISLLNQQLVSGKLDPEQSGLVSKLLPLLEQKLVSTAQAKGSQNSETALLKQLVSTLGGDPAAPSAQPLPSPASPSTPAKGKVDASAGIGGDEIDAMIAHANGQGPEVNFADYKTA